MKNNSHQQGFTLIEVLIAFIILSLGLLGAIALQAKAKQASFDAMQRSAAISLGNDIIQRMRANDTASFANLYQKNFNSQTALQKVSPCYQSSCSSQQIAALDMQQWVRAIRARENTGALDQANVCITTAKVSGGLPNEYEIEVVVSWQGRQEFKTNDENKGKKCGTANDSRRLVVLNSYIYLRS
ncbi:type IV pilus modification protein PilV [Pseudoalteromonas sp. SSMSWG5]|uniref:type IV pilus modification protein PilV n=1 Tax=Pseudoalteromonas sp. SSMSWG5 TaxID=3139396 RepID=UPI003BAC8FEE